MSYNFDRQVDRNIRGQTLEKGGRLSEAIILYEANLCENFEGSFPCKRLSIIYGKQKNYSEEIRVLEKAVEIYNNLSASERGDVNPKLLKFTARLYKAKLKALKV